MNGLYIYVCENYIPEFQYIVDNENLENVEIVSFKSFCDGGFSVGDHLSGAISHLDTGMDAVLVCGHLCRAPRKYEHDKKFSKIYESDFCYSHMISDHFARFFLEEGYYVITTGWLIHWEEHLGRQGFSQEAAREFYKLSCTKLVFLDSGIYDEAEKSLAALSGYLDIPAKSIPVSLDPIKNLIDLIFSDWKSRNSGTEKHDDIHALRELNARNSAIMNIMSKIAGAEYQRDVISMLDQIWMILFGATKSHFWSFSKGITDLPPKVRALNFSNEQIYIIDRENNTFYALLESGGEKYGVIEVGDFLFPENADKYTEMFNSLIRIASLAISNAQRYEELVRSKNKFEYSSHHDGLTGAFNRTYYNKIVGGATDYNPSAAFSFDLDGLKAVNDNLGHSEGDLLIVQAVEVLKKTFRESDQIFRMGGDEFTVLVNDCDQELAEKLERRLQDIIKKQNQKNTLKLSISAGFCVSSGADDNIESMVQAADMKMYKEKRRRKAK